MRACARAKISKRLILFTAREKSKACNIYCSHLQSPVVVFIVFSQKFFLLVLVSSSFQDVVSFFESLPFGLGALFFFSLFCVVSHYLCGCVCVFSFFFCSLVGSTVRKKLSIETRARVVAKKREISFGDESREEETKECGPE